MKHILYTLAVFGLFIAALHADPPAVVIHDNGTISRDGISLNNAADALKNALVTTKEFQAALAAKLEDSAADVASAQAAQQRAEAKLKLLVDGAKDALTKATSPERLAAGNELLAKVQATQTEEERAALLKQQEEIAAKLEALSAAESK